MVRENLLEVVIGAIVLAVAAAFLAYSFSVAGPRGGGAGYALYGDFPNVGGLGVGSDVRIAGIKIGTVSQVALDPATYRARVAISVDPAIQIPADSVLALKSESLLGGVYLEIQPGGDARALAPGETFEDPGQGAVDFVRLLTELIQQLGNRP